MTAKFGMIIVLALLSISQFALADTTVESVDQMLKEHEKRVQEQERAHDAQRVQEFNREVAESQALYEKQAQSDAPRFQWVPIVVIVLMLPLLFYVLIAWGRRVNTSLSYQLQTISRLDISIKQQERVIQILETMEKKLGDHGASSPPE